MRKPDHEASLNHLLKSGGGARTWDGAAPEFVALLAGAAGLLWLTSVRTPSRQLSLVPVGREVKPRPTARRQGGRLPARRTTYSERSRQFLPPPPPPDG